MVVIRRQEEIQKELENCGEDMEKMSLILDELDSLSSKVRVHGTALHLVLTLTYPLRNHKSRAKFDKWGRVLKNPRCTSAGLKQGLCSC